MIFPQTAFEVWGVEDPRITQIGDKHQITYSAASSRGVGVGLAETDDFVTYKRHRVILAPENKDVMLFPEKIGGKYSARGSLSLRPRLAKEQGTCCCGGSTCGRKPPIYNCG
ncbi:hypothetical protein [Paenibacillus phytohabitans]|uniref:glycoside hydrolase family 130 protein n=1 Tax=Paenibacillus phytohabitans TaxID=2654978 RepID=UPI00300A25ED